MHTDYARTPNIPEFSMTGVGVWALEDWTVASGPTYIVPSSRKQRAARAQRRPQRGRADRDAEGLGGLAYHGVWHWQGERTEPGDRVTLHAHFNRGILRSLEPKKTDVQLLHRNSPRLGEMLGEDDWFDKMSAQGRDHTRFAYMNKLHAFTAERRQAILADAN